MGESMPGNSDLQPPVEQADLGAEVAPSPDPSAPPVEPGQGDGQGEAGEGGGGQEDGWSADRRQGYLDGTQKYADQLQERDRMIEHLQIEREVERRQAAPAQEEFPEQVPPDIFRQAQRASPEFKALMEKVDTLEGTVSESVIENQLARLGRDHGKRPFHQDVAGKVRTALRGSADLKPGTVEAAYHHFAAPKVEELLLKAESELRGLRKAKKDAIATDGFSAPGGRVAGGEAPGDVKDMSDEELANAYARALMEKTGAA